MAQIDFVSIAARLLAQADTLVPQWLPGGKRRGREWVCGNLRGDAGASCSINLETGAWADFAAGSSGGDLIALYAAIHTLSQAEAAFELTPEDGGTRANSHEPAAPRKPEKPAERPALPIPEDAVLPPPPRSWGPVNGEWWYHLATGERAFAVRRFDPPGERKQFLPYTWRGGDWDRKSYPAPRPLYRLPELLAHSDAPVLIVEGEKSVEAAIPYLSGYQVTTWAGGSKVVKSADWRPLTGRDVTVWPDADDPGAEAAAALVGILLRLGCRVRVIKVTEKSGGWDIADAINEDWSSAQLVEFMASHEVLVEPPQAKPAQAVEPMPALEGSVFVRWDEMGLAKAPGGMPHQNLSNAMLVLQNHPKVAGKLWLDTFRGRIYHALRGTPQEWNDNDDLAMTAWIQQSVGLHKIGVQTVSNAVSGAAAACARNSLHEWLNGLSWDNVSRLDHWLGDYLGVGLTPYSMSVGRNWLVSMVARAFEPGCKVDHMPVLEGITGRGKSTAIEILGGEWYAALPDAFGAKGFLENIEGTWLIEIPDLAGFSRRDHNHIVAVITTRSDRYREAYGRRVKEHQRTCVFAATSENDEYLQSSVGIRRFWPLRCAGAEAINLAGLREARAQLFAEAVHMYRTHASWHETPEEDTRAEQAERREDDPWMELVLTYCGRHREVTASEALTYALNMDPAKQSQPEKRRVGAILRSAGWHAVVAKRHGGTIRVWKNPTRVDTLF